MTEERRGDHGATQDETQLGANDGSLRRFALHALDEGTCQELASDVARMAARLPAGLLSRREADTLPLTCRSWTHALARVERLLSEADQRNPADVLDDVFRCILQTLLKGEPMPGCGVATENRARRFGNAPGLPTTPELQRLRRAVTAYLRTEVEKGTMISVSPDLLADFLLGTIHGILFTQSTAALAERPADVSIEEFSSLARTLAASIMIPKNQSSKLYYDAIGSRYSALYCDTVSRAEDEFVADRLLEVVVPRARVLDLGCGLGLAYDLLMKRGIVPSEYTGIDISSEMIRQARRRHASRAGVDFRVMDIESMSYFPTSSFDSVISLFGSFSHAIHHDLAISELYRVLKRGSCFLVMLLSRTSLRAFAKVIRTFDLQHVSEVHPYEIRKTSGAINANARFYTRRTILEAFSAFRDVRIVGLNGGLEVIPFLQRLQSVARVSPMKRFLQAESRALAHFPSLCHSMIVTGSKP